MKIRPFYLWLMAWTAISLEILGYVLWKHRVNARRMAEDAAA